MTIAETADLAREDDRDRVKKAKSRRTEAAARDGCVRRALHLFLAVTLGIDAIIVLCLAVRDFTLTRALLDSVGSVVLLVIGIVCACAFVAVCRCYSTWLPTTLASQIGVALLAGYVWRTDLHSHSHQWVGVMGVAVVIGAIAIFWVSSLARYAKAPFVKGIGALLAILPIFSLVQFWIQSDYMPRTSRPMVDVEAELLPIGASDRTIHVLAKVTLRNRGSVEVNVVGALMRVTAYRKSSPQQPDRSRIVADAIDLTGSRDFRAVETSPASSRLLYAGVVASVGTFLGPGETDTYNRLIDVDADADGLTRLSFTAYFLTKRELDKRPCGGQRISDIEDQDEFSRELSPLIQTSWGAHLRCLDVDIAPGGVVQELVADDQSMRLLVVADDPADRDSEYPQMYVDLGRYESDSRSEIDPKKFDNANPGGFYTDTAEYSPTDKDLKGDTSDAKR